MLCQIKKYCPECNSTIFREDIIHAEVYCLKCGLVLVAPPKTGLVFPGFTYKKKENDKKLN